VLDMVGLEIVSAVSIWCQGYEVSKATIYVEDPNSERRVLRGPMLLGLLDCIAEVAAVSEGAVTCQ